MGRDRIHHYKTLFLAPILALASACAPQKDSYRITVNTGIPVRPPVSLSDRISSLFSVNLGQECYVKNVRMAVYNADTEQVVSTQEVLFKTNMSNSIAYGNQSSQIDSAVSHLLYNSSFDQPLEVDVPGGGNFEIAMIGNMYQPKDINGDGICDEINRAAPLLLNNWVFKAGMASGKSKHTATKLLDGTILIVGGTDTAPAPTPANTAIVYRYHPMTNSWSTPAPLPTPSAEHTANHLPDGKVLIVGGVKDDGSANTTYRVYDPATDLWTSHSPSYASKNSATVNLPNGNVLVTGGEYISTTLSYVQMFDASPTATPAISLRAPLNAARTRHTATLLPNGKVLIYGGRTYTGTLVNDYEIYDPINNLSTSYNFIDASYQRSDQHALLLRDGRVLITGGLDSTGSALGSVKIYTPDAGAGTWGSVTNFPSPRVKHQVVQASDGNVWMIGGCDAAGATITSSSTLVLNPASIAGGWTSKYSPQNNRAFHQAVKMGDQILIIGGFGTNILNTVEQNTSISPAFPSSNFFGHAPVDATVVANRSINLSMQVLHTSPTQNYDGSASGANVTLMPNKKDIVEFASYFLPMGLGGQADLVSAKMMDFPNSIPMMVPLRTDTTVSTSRFYLPHIFPYELIFNYHSMSVCPTTTGGVGFCGLYRVNVFGASSAVTQYTLTLIPSVSNHINAPATIQTQVGMYNITTY